MGKHLDFSFVFFFGVGWGHDLFLIITDSVISHPFLLPSLSSPIVPDVSIFREVIGDAFALALVAYAISISLGKTFALKHGYRVDSNQVKQILNGCLMNSFFFFF